MIKFFRKLRQRTLSKNNFSKYLLYAIGEIILVVIGILIALQINNWNEKRVQQNILTNYYERMHEELESSRDNLVSFLKQLEELGSQNRKALEILASKNRDSINVLKETMGSLGTAWTNNFNYPIVEEFMNEGYLAKVNNLEIKNNQQAFSIQITKLNNLDNGINSQYNNIIEPFINKNLNYYEIALGRYKEGLVAGGPATDFDKLYTNLEAWNILTLKLELTNSHQTRLKSFIAMIERLSQSLASEIHLEN